MFPEGFIIYTLSSKEIFDPTLINYRLYKGEQPFSKKKTLRNTLKQIFCIVNLDHVVIFTHQKRVTAAPPTLLLSFNPHASSLKLFKYSSKKNGM